LLLEPATGVRSGSSVHIESELVLRAGTFRCSTEIRNSSVVRIRRPDILRSRLHNPGSPASQALPRLESVVAPAHGFSRRVVAVEAGVARRSQVARLRPRLRPEAPAAAGFGGDSNPPVESDYRHDPEMRSRVTSIGARRS